MLKEIVDKDLQKIQRLEQQLKEAKKEYSNKKEKENDKMFIAMKPQLNRFKKLCNDEEFTGYKDMLQFFEEHKLNKLKIFFLTK